MSARTLQMLSILSALISSSVVHAQSGCPDQFKQFLKNITENKSNPQIQKDVYFEMTQIRMNGVHPDLYDLAQSLDEKHELTLTLNLLDLHNNKKKLFSTLEQQFHDAYFVFSKKGLPCDELHTYFRSIVRDDIVQAKEVADQILSRFPRDSHELIGKRMGLHSSSDPFWETFSSKSEVQTTIIDYRDHEIDAAKGALVSPDRNTQLGRMAAGMEEVHGVKIATVPEAIASKRAHGFSTSKASYIDLEARNGIEVQGRMIVIPSEDVEFNRISSVTNHEARHAYYSTQRRLKSSSAVDTNMIAINGNKLGESVGYSTFQSSEELSTHARDLTEVFRTGNREILNLYKTQKTLPTHQLIDIATTEAKTKTLQHITDQTIKNTTDAIQELAHLKKTSVEKLQYFVIALSDEGYEISFRVDNRFLMKTYIASKPERSLVTQYVAAYEPLNNGINAIRDEILRKADPTILALGKADPKNSKFQELLKNAYKEAESQINPQLTRNATEKLAPVLDALEQSILRTREAAETTAKKTKAIRELIESFHAGQNGTLTREEYLKVRDVLTAPSSTFVGTVKKDAEETRKALEAIRKKREARKLGN